ncbi:MAG: HAMP domain-containing sensor histidine kinase [Nitratireductor sp.]
MAGMPTLQIRSLRTRLLVFAFSGIAISLIVTGFGLSALFDRHLTRRIGTELDTYLAQLAGNLIITRPGEIELPFDPVDPRFEKVFSGLYWQVVNEASGTVLRSNSLWDEAINLPTDQPEIGVIHEHKLPGPAGENLLVHERRLLLESGQSNIPVRIVIAIDSAELAELKSDFLTETMTALAILGALLFAGLWVQVRVGLAPLDRLRDGVAGIRAGHDRQLSREQPEEVLPLVDEINFLVEAKENEAEKARNRAGDLAHGLKTPLTILSGDIRRLREQGSHKIAADIENVSNMMRRHVERQLAKARRRYGAPGNESLDIASTTRRLVATMSRLPGAGHISFEVEIQPGSTCELTADDFNDVVGNLLENAVRAARSKVAISLTPALGDEPRRFTVEDDGPGVPEARMGAILTRGKRLDEKSGGAGLGLAIVSDILEEYDTSLVTARSQLGGLSIGFALPANNAG